MLENTTAFPSFSVQDIREAQVFYRDVLNVKVGETPEGCELHLANGLRVFLYPKPNHVPATFTVLNFVVESIDACVDDLVARGVMFEKYDNEYLKSDEKGIHRINSSTPHPGPQAIAWCKDPAGNIISIIQK